MNKIDLTSMKAVAVTGATGFVADTLIQKLIKLGVKVHAIARNEGDLVSLQLKYPTIKIFPCPIEAEYLLRKAFSGCDGVFHLAAIKGVHIAEQHPLKTIQTNIIGTTNILKLSVDVNLKFVVAASSDKAEKISGVYGASKYIVEKLFQEFQSINPEGCCYRVVRFGNVFYSTGSVLDVWKKSLEEGSELVITDPESTRFFWTKEEAVDYLFECISNMPDAQPYIPEMKSVKIGSLLREMISVYGDSSTKIREIGLGESENKHEFLVPDVSSQFAKQWKTDELRKVLKGESK